MNIAMGAIFLAKQHGDEIILELVTSYAYHENKYHKKHLNWANRWLGHVLQRKGQFI